MIMSVAVQVITKMMMVIHETPLLTVKTFLTPSTHFCDKLQRFYSLIHSRPGGRREACSHYKPFYTNGGGGGTEAQMKSLF